MASNQRHPPGPPMTLGNVRELGVQNLLASCLNDACRHQALIDVSSYPAETEVLHAMVRLLSKVIGIGIETADMLVREILSRNLRDRRAVARYAGLTGSPDESGLKSREKGLAKAGNARVRRGLIQLVARFNQFERI